MEVKGANPFLFTDDDYISPSAGNSNPFLLEGDDFMDSSGGDNPFLSQSATTMSSQSTNPFAFDPMDLEPHEAEQAEVTTFQGGLSNFSAAVTENTSTTFNQQDLLMNSENIIPTSLPQKPTDLDLKYSNNIQQSSKDFQNFDGIQTNDRNKVPPPRPPPSKETQDLLMSVMGAMDATSSHLLDRIPPTRSPSPVSMRDLHSPSPTPEPQAPDLIDVSTSNVVPTATVVSQGRKQSLSEELLMNMEHQNDINHNPPLSQAIPPISNQGSMAPIRPPRPQPPKKPPPPAFAQSMILNDSTKEQQRMPPPKPPPPSKTKSSPPSKSTTSPLTDNKPSIPPQPKRLEDDMMDMFGVETAPPVQKPVASKADILNLYNAPAKQEQKLSDLLFDNLDSEMPSDTVGNEIKPLTETFGTSSNLSEASPGTIGTGGSASGSFPATPVVQDNFISPEPSQADLQMDTSDSQSKGSVSSVTFNPFAGNEDVVLSPNKQTAPPQESNIYAQEANKFPKEAVQDSEIYIQKSTVHTQELSQKTSTISQEPLSQDNYSQEPFCQEPIGFTKEYPIQKQESPVFAQETIPKSTENQIIFSQEPTLSVLQKDIKEDILLQESTPDIFSSIKPETQSRQFNAAVDDFDAFAAKFESAGKDENKNGTFDAFTGGSNAWGSDATDSGFNEGPAGFGADDSFDAFLALREPPAVPQSTPNRVAKGESQDSDEGKDFSVFIRPKNAEPFDGGHLPTIAPPPVQTQTAFNDSSPRFNPFDQESEHASVIPGPDVALPFKGEMQRSDSQETPPTPLYDEDVSQPLEPFPRTLIKGDLGWEMQLRQPNKKKITGQRFWKKIFVKLVYQADCILLQLYNQASDKDPFQELPLQPCYSVSDIGAQQYDNFGKIFTLKLQYIFYKERPGVRPGQVKKAERITNKLSQFAAYAIQGDYQGVKEFGSDLKKLGLPVEHAPQVSQLMKLGSLNYEDLKQFSVCIEEALFTLQAHRDRALHYKMEEVQISVVDELYVEQNSEGHVEKQIARVRLFFLGFLTGMPDVELGINDMRRQGKEVVGRHDIIPVVTEEWIRLEAVEFNSCVQQDEYEKTHIIKFKPPDACYIELLRFRVRPPRNRELPLQLKPTICINGNKIELRADVLVPGFASRKLGQVPCEDVMIRFPIPECWIYMFRVEKHFRYGSVKSAHRRTGKVKGIERLLGTMETLQESLIEVTSGQAKYEHQHRAIVWRCPRLPKEGQGAYTTHNMVCRLALTSFDQMPEQLAEYCYVEFTMPATQVSHTTVRSVSLQNSDSDEPPEKYVRYLARHEYKVGIEHTEAEGPNPYLAATHVSKPAPVVEETPKTIPEAESSSDSD